MFVLLIVLAICTSNARHLEVSAGSALSSRCRLLLLMLKRYSRATISSLSMVWIATAATAAGTPTGWRIIPFTLRAERKARCPLQCSHDLQPLPPPQAHGAMQLELDKERT